MKETMTSRERVLAAIEHRIPDRMPIDLGMHFSTGISAFAYHELRKYLGLDTDNIRVPDVIQFLARVDDDILRRFHCDCILLDPPFVQPHVFSPRDDLRFIVPHTFRPILNEKGEWHADGIEGKHMRMPPNGYFFDGDWPCFRDSGMETYLDRSAREAERIFHETEYFTMFQGVSGIYDQSIEMMLRMYEEPDELLADNEKETVKEIAFVKKIAGKMGDHIQGLCLGSDLGAQNGPMMNPDMYAEFFAPYLKRLCTCIHEYSGYKVFMHTCGSIKPFLPILIDCGIDIINPVQHTAKDMDPKELKETFGGKLTFWGGGVSCQTVLNFGTADEVRQNVRELTAIFKPNGGFVFNPIHNILGNVPPEKIVAVYDEAYKNSFY